jgi:3-methylcrotonyl-CoA carboxylase beta subunit
MWPAAKISVMGGQQAADVLWTVKKSGLEAEGKKTTAREEAEFKRPVVEKYEREGSAYYSTARLWDDGILDPIDTRRAVALGISLSLNAPIPEHRFGVFRM